MTDEELKELRRECAQVVDSYDLGYDCSIDHLELCSGPTIDKRMPGYSGRYPEDCGDWVWFDDYFLLFKKLKETEDMLSQVETELSEAQVHISMFSNKGVY